MPRGYVVAQHVYSNEGLEEASLRLVQWEVRDD